MNKLRKLCETKIANIMKNIVITGASQGIGKATAVEAAKKGFTIATNDKEILTKLKILKINALKITENTKLVWTEGDLK